MEQEKQAAVDEDEVVSSQGEKNELIFNRGEDSEVIESQVEESQPISSQVEESQPISSQVEDSEAISSQVEDSEAISSQVEDSEAISSQVEDSEAISSQVEEGEAIFSQGEGSKAISSQGEEGEAIFSQVEEIETGHPDSDHVSIKESKGAQILLKRFSSWRRKANETVVQNVNAFSKSDIAQKLKSQAELVKSRAEAFSQTEIANKLKEQAESVKTRADKVFSKTEDIDDQNQQQIPAAMVITNSDVLDAEIGASEKCDNDDSFSRDKDGVSESKKGASDNEARNTVTGERFSLSPDLATASASTAALYVRTATTVISDSVSTSFRGRYVGDSEPAVNKKELPSQTAKMLSSRAAEHMQSIINSLDETHEYVMLLGQGKLGVNLRQTYLRNHGVYVDFLVEGGAAFTSSVVYPGDILLKVGNISVTKGTILSVPKTISDSRRPVLLVFSTGQKVDTSRVNFIDVAIAMMHRIKEEADRGISKMPLFPESTIREIDAVESGLGFENSNRLSQIPNPAFSENTDKGFQENLVWEIEIPNHPLDAVNPANVPTPPENLLLKLSKYLARR
jgi:hypothetical protein